MKSLKALCLLASFPGLSSAHLFDFSLGSLLFDSHIASDISSSKKYHGLPLNASTEPLISDGSSKYIETLLHEWNSTGLAVAVVQRDTSLSNRAHPGWKVEFASYGSISAATGTVARPVTPDTLFPIASNSKLFLAISVGLIISNQTLSNEFRRVRGVELDWKTRMIDIMPDIWKLWDKDAEKGATIQDLLSHRTGLPRHDMSLVPRKGGVREMISTLRHLRPSASFRETFQYNNFMFETLTYLPILSLNQSYESYIEEHLLRPLNMSSTIFSLGQIEHDPDLRHRMAHGHLPDGRDLRKGLNGTLKPIVPYWLRPGEEKALAGAGGVISTTRDLSTWIGMLLNEGRHPYTNDPIVPPSVLEYVTHGRVVAVGAPAYPDLSPQVYGCGQFRYTYRGTDVIEHGGNIPGFQSQVARFPHHELGILALSNDGETGGAVLESAKWRILDDIAFQDQPVVDWNSRYRERRAAFKKSMREDVTAPPSPRERPSGGFEVLGQKAFEHPTYGTLVPCLVPSLRGEKPDAALAQAALRASTPEESDDTSNPYTNCTQILTLPSTQRILSASPPDSATYIITYPKITATHLRLTHFNANLFNASVIWSNADVRRVEGLDGGGLGDIDGRGDMLYGLEDQFTVEWVPGEGLAFKGGFWGNEGPDSREPRGEGREGAEVWFGIIKDAT